MEILSCKDLSFRYNSGSKNTLSSVSFSIDSSRIVLLLGKTGSGKSTLLRLLKKEIAPAGELSGEIRLFSKAQSQISSDESARAIAYVSQNPDTQTVTHKVSSELAFGLESFGLSSPEILSRVGEMATYFGIEDIYDKPIDQLSGGEKQLCSLCAATVMSPQILLLDEPAAQLDPIGSSKFFAALRRLNSELGTTIILAEHDPQEIFEFCDEIIVLDQGSATCYNSRESFVQAALHSEQLYSYLPAQTRAALKLGKTVFTVKEAKNLLEERFPVRVTDSAKNTAGKEKKQAAVIAENLYFRYDRSEKDIVSCLDLTVYKGEVFAAVGSNGSGKTTMLKVLSGILKPWQGKILINGKNIRSYKGGSLYRRNVAVMPQDPYDLFIRASVREEFEQTISNMGEKTSYEQLCSDFSILHLLDMHPYDLSGGEVQKCAMVKLLLTQPSVLFLDEPSKGLDPQAKAVFGQTLRELAVQGTTVCIATHDIEFAAQYADRCGLFFNGCIHSTADSKGFFSYNRFYTTAASRIARGVFADAVTSQELECCITGGETP